MSAVPCLSFALRHLWAGQQGCQGSSVGDSGLHRTPQAALVPSIAVLRERAVRNDPQERVWAPIGLQATVQALSRVWVSVLEPTLMA